MDDSDVEIASKPKGKGKIRRRVRFDDSTMDDNSAQMDSPGSTIGDSNGKVVKTSGNVSEMRSPKTDVSSGSSGSVSLAEVRDGGIETEKTNASVMDVLDSPSIVEVADSDDEKKNVSLADIAMKSIASILLDSDDDDENSKKTGDVSEVPDSDVSACVVVEEFKKPKKSPVWGGGDVVVLDDSDDDSVIDVEKEKEDHGDSESDEGPSVDELFATLRAKLERLEKEHQLRLQALDTKPVVDVVPKYELEEVVATTTATGNGGGDSRKLDFGGARPKTTNPWQGRQNDDLMRQNFAVGGASNRLYGGKMTDARDNEIKAITNEAIQSIHEAITAAPGEADETKDPPGLLVPLLERQRQALAWLQWRETQHPSGGILADDMGLGKTLTIISLIMQQKYCNVEDAVSRNKDRKKILDREKLVESSASLIVCPASIIHQWQKEIERRVKPGKLSVHVYRGQYRESDPTVLARFDVVLTTYGTISSEISEKTVVGHDSDDDAYAGASKKKGRKRSSPLMEVAWERIVLDEGHTIKNHGSKTAQACCKLPAASRWILTGTPLQNQLKDMYSLLKFFRFSPFNELAVWNDADILFGFRLDL